MMWRWPVVLSATLLATAGASAEGNSAGKRLEIGPVGDSLSVVGTEVQQPGGGVLPLPGGRQASVRVKVQNRSGRAAYAVSVEITCVYADGSRGEPVTQGFDLPALYVSTAGYPEALKTGKLLRPGETYASTMGVSPDREGWPPVTASARVKAVLFE